MSKVIRASRYHDFSYGHRVFGHESKCANAHGHNGRVTFVVEADLDDVGRVLDFSIINVLLCQWVERNWDHRFLLYAIDPWLEPMSKLDASIVALPCNPTAENLANHLLTVVGPEQLWDTGVRLVQVQFDETRKCSAIATLA